MGTVPGVSSLLLVASRGIQRQNELAGLGDFEGGADEAFDVRLIRIQPVAPLLERLALRGQLRQLPVEPMLDKRQVDLVDGAGAEEDKGDDTGGEQATPALAAPAGERRGRRLSDYRPLRAGAVRAERPGGVCADPKRGHRVPA